MFKNIIIFIIKYMNSKIIVKLHEYLKNEIIKYI